LLFLSRFVVVFNFVTCFSPVKEWFFIQYFYGSFNFTNLAKTGSILIEAKTNYCLQRVATDLTDKGI